MRQADLTARDPDLYTRTGLIAMAARNAAVKAAPQRWQDERALAVAVAVTAAGGGQAGDALVKRALPFPPHAGLEGLVKAAGAVAEGAGGAVRGGVAGDLVGVGVQGGR